ncbi:Secretory carrier-associated membrane protein 2 [Cichlidogyrus casuarinus]|uniref:Secretory carrier-associated membrane protein n=1 Tax=Cichlidogyrus casuarinus TaxID=1844966 RepID=A0ABD2QIJ3_9PLAT
MSSTPENSKPTFTELEKRQKELDARSKELDRREAEQRRLEADHARIAGPEKNFPPLPNCCPLKPCFYQAIDVDISPHHRPIVTLGFRLWLAYSIIIAINFVGAIIYFAASNATNGGPLFGMAIFALLICPPASYVGWFRPLYKAFKTNSSFNFFTFFFIMFAQLIVIFLQSMAFFNMGTVGLLYALAVAHTGWLCALMFLILLGFVAVGGGMCYLLLKVHGVFRNSGATFQQAKYEFMTGVASDPTMRTVAAEAALGTFGQNAGANNQSQPQTTGKY